MNFNEELYELENYKGSGFSSFLKDQSKKFIKKGIEKAVNTGGEKVGELIVNKIIPSSSSSSNQNSEDKNQNIYTNPEIPIDSGYKIIKLLKKNQPVDNIRKQYISI